MAVYKGKPTKDGRQYFFRIKYKDIFGNTVDYNSQKYKSKKEATDEEALYRIKLNKKEINRNNPTFDEIFSEWYQHHLKEVKKQSAIKDYNLYKHLDIIKGININYYDIQKHNVFLNSLDQKKLSTLYKNKILGLLRILIKYSNKYYNTSDNMLKFIENYKNVNLEKREMDFFTYDEYKKFDSVISKHQWHTFFEILYFMGLRQGECQALTWKDINFKKQELSINKTLTSKIKGENYTISSPKTKNSTRTLPLPNIVLNDLKIMYNDAIKYSDFNNDWFVFGNSLPFKETTIQTNKNQYCELSGLKQIRIHDFRHSCASFLINQGASITLVSKYLGHSKVSITLDVYSHFYKSELINITELINNL